MPKTKPKPKAAIPEAIRELRQISEESQQFFGARLRISTRALQIYEMGERVPEPKQLIAFAAYADFVGRPELADLFIEELEQQLTPPPGYVSAVVFKRRDTPVDTTAMEVARITGRARRKR
jgi:transcriptional regulator with XRE-family HTH domain